MARAGEYIGPSEHHHVPWLEVKKKRAGRHRLLEAKVVEHYYDMSHPDFYSHEDLKAHIFTMHGVEEYDMEDIPSGDLILMHNRLHAGIMTIGGDGGDE